MNINVELQRKPEDFRLDNCVIDVIEAKYMDEHLEHSILFDRLNEEGDLVFSVKL